MSAPRWQPPKAAPFLGKWRLVELEHWDQAFIDLVETGHILFELHGSGRMIFGADNLCLDWVPGEDGRVEFTFEGTDEMDNLFGRGWAAVVSGVLRGAICFHGGEDCALLAKKWPIGEEHP